MLLLLTLMHKLHLVILLVLLLGVLLVVAALSAAAAAAASAVVSAVAAATVAGAALVSCTGTPGPEWADSGCDYTRVGSNCTASCPSGQQGIGHVATCTVRGWQVTARDCRNSTCTSLPTVNAPPGSKGWDSECAGRDDGETCQAACEASSALVVYKGPGYTSTCEAGQWTVQPGGGCAGKGHWV
jgi:hypothetical protein